MFTLYGNTIKNEWEKLHEYEKITEIDKYICFFIQQFLKYFTNETVF